MIRLFTGFDQREAIGWHAFTQSVIWHASGPVAIVPLAQGAQRDGSNAFTYARFSVPELCEFEGWAIFVDGADMICTADIAELWKLRDERFAVQVVKHDYRTKHLRKYIGTAMECGNMDYPRKNWSSVILWNCGHKANRILTAENIADQPGSYLHRFEWLFDDEIGELPHSWNWLPQEFGVNSQAKLLHFTAGIPSIGAYSRGAHTRDFFTHVESANESPIEATEPVCLT